MAEVLDRKPLRTFLTQREPLLPRRKVINLLGCHSPNDIWGDIIREFAQGPPPAIDRVKPAEAIEVMAGSSWAFRLAEGVCGPRYVGLTPGTDEYERCVYNVSHKVAARSLGMEWTPTPTPVPARRRRR